MTEETKSTDTSSLIDAMADGGLDQICQPGVILISCGCSRERRKRCTQRRKNRTGCEIPITEEDMANLYNSLPNHSLGFAIPAPENKDEIGGNHP